MVLLGPPQPLNLVKAILWFIDWSPFLFTGSEILSCLRELWKVKGLGKGWEVGEIGWRNYARMLNISQSKKG